MMCFLADTNYKFTKEFISRTDLCPLTGFEYISYFKMPITFNYNSPSVMLFKKKDDGFNVMTHFFALFMFNYMFQIPIPLNELDTQIMIGKRRLNVNWLPAIFGTNDITKLVEIYEDCLKLDSNIKKSDSTDYIKLPMNSEDLEYVKFKNSDGTFNVEKLDLSKIKSIQVQRF